jgi:hypothetical protein
MSFNVQFPASVSDCTVACLQVTTQRLGEAAASTTFYAGHKLSISHFLFRGATAAVAPNRKLSAGIRECCRFRFIFEVYFLLGKVHFSTAMSDYR